MHHFSAKHASGSHGSFHLRQKNQYFHQDRQAMRIADRYGMTHAYKVSRRNNLSPIEALEDWDLIKPEDYSHL